MAKPMILISCLLPIEILVQASFDREMTVIRADNDGDDDDTNSGGGRVIVVVECWEIVESRDLVIHDVSFYYLLDSAFLFHCLNHLFHCSFLQAE